MNDEITSILTKEQFDKENMALGIKKAKDIILRSYKEGDERAERYARLSQVIAEVLPPEEQKDFLANPIGFISQKLLFRGVGQSELEKILITGIMKPQCGDHGTAVFTTDSPKGAVDFVSENGALLVLDRDKINYVDPDIGIEDENSDELKAKSRVYRASLSPEKQEDALYFPYDQFDTCSPYSSNSPWHIIHLRKEQSLDSLDKIIAFDLKGEPTKFDPNDSDQRAELEKVILRKL